MPILIYASFDSNQTSEFIYGVLFALLLYLFEVSVGLRTCDEQRNVFTTDKIGECPGNFDFLFSKSDSFRLM